MAKNLVSKPILVLLAQIWTQHFFSWIFLLLHNRHCCKLSLHAISRKINEPNLRKWQKTYFQDRFWLLWPKFGPRNFFYEFYLHYILGTVSSYHYMQFQGKLMNQTSVNSKKPSFGHNFGPFGPNLGHQNLAPSVTTYHGQLSSCTLSEKTND